MLDVLIGSFIGALAGTQAGALVRWYLDKRNLNGPIIKKGWKITCPDKACGREIARAKKDVYSTQVLTIKPYESIGGHEITEDTKPVCPDCDTAYYLASTQKIHTNKGWR